MPIDKTKLTKAMLNEAAMFQAEEPSSKKIY